MGKGVMAKGVSGHPSMGEGTAAQASPEGSSSSGEESEGSADDDSDVENVDAPKAGAASAFPCLRSEIESSLQFPKMLDSRSRWRKGWILRVVLSCLDVSRHVRSGHA